MTATTIRPTNRTSNDWFRELLRLSRPAANGTELTIIRNDAGITVFRTNADRIEADSVYRTIDQAYTAVRSILTAHPDYGFYIV